MNAVTGLIDNLDMTLDMAQTCIAQIHHHLEQAEHHLTDARALIWQLHEYNGWKALGYPSWRACVTAEFNRSSSTIYRQLNAALVELELSPSGGIGTYPERVLRPLTARSFDSEARSAIMHLAQEAVGEGAKITSSVIEETISTLKQVLITNAVETGDGEMFPLGEAISGQIIAQVRERRLAHQDDVKRMGKKRNYILGGVAIDKLTRGALDDGRVAIMVSVDDLQRAKLLDAAKAKFYTDKPIYIALWTEE